jgi:glycosyltransferase involved in cell wall biosynthesis
VAVLMKEAVGGQSGIGPGIGSGMSSGIEPGIDVTIVMPCLNEVDCLPTCIANAREALATMKQRYGLTGEIVIADNGSTDGSQAIATSLGARVVPVSRRGYGAALSGGATAAYGRFLVMGDADGSYDFRDGVAMVGELMQGAELCMGSRFKGGIAPGAMPWKNRYIGNPVLTGILNILFRSGIEDAHCGLRALTRPAFDQLKLTGDGMEFASEMVIKATLKGLKIAEVPATLSRDLRNRPPHLRPWRDGWRHLRYLLMLSPAWLFAVPAAVLSAAGVLILLMASLAALKGTFQTSFFGNYWVVLAGGLLTISHTAALLAAAGNLYGIREGYRQQRSGGAGWAKWISLETMLIAGLACMTVGFVVLGYLLSYWSTHRFEPIVNVLPAVIGTSLIVIGAQNVLGGFLLSIVNGNDADLMRPVPQSASQAASQSASQSAIQSAPQSASSAQVGPLPRGSA